MEGWEMAFRFVSENLVLWARSETICYSIRDQERGFARLSVSVGLAEEKNFHIQASGKPCMK